MGGVTRGGHADIRERRGDTRSEVAQQAVEWPIEELDIDASVKIPILAKLRSRREGQRSQAGFGLLAGRERVYLKRSHESGTSLTEHGPDGRRLRQVEIDAGGKLSRADRFVLNPPFDLYDPALVPMEVSAQEFEDFWLRAREGQAG
jgi:hypothetical protein